LVEDNEIMRDLLGEVLEEEGYDVLSAAEPLEALERSRTFEGWISLVVSDVVMPNMSGFLLARELRSQRPDIQVLYMSGYTDQVLADHGELRDDDPFIRKPFGNDALLTKIREVLDSIS
jgi:two-component system cell cycle sensor histidine kinase/response regulator CckA